MTGWQKTGEERLSWWKLTLSEMGKRRGIGYLEKGEGWMGEWRKGGWRKMGEWRKGGGWMGDLRKGGGWMGEWKKVEWGKKNILEEKVYAK